MNNRSESRAHHLGKFGVVLSKGYLQNRPYCIQISWERVSVKGRQETDYGTHQFVLHYLTKELNFAPRKTLDTAKKRDLLIADRLQRAVHDNNMTERA